MENRMEKEGRKIQPRPKEDLFMNFAVWGLILLTFVTMSLNIIMLRHIMNPWRYQSTVLHKFELLEVGDEMEEGGVLDWNEIRAKMTRSRKKKLQRSLGGVLDWNEIPAKMTRSRKKKLQRSLGS